MKQIAVSKIPYGEIFCVFGDTFVALDRVDGGVLAIRRDIWKKGPFDKAGNNDFRRASIRKDLGNYLIDFWKNGANWESTIMATIDLKSTDGTREYGYDYGMGAALLTLEQYGKYQHIIPDVEEGWLMATPWRTPGEKCGGYSSIWLVGSNGNVVCVCCFDAYGIRPALVFAPSLLVEYDDGDAELDGTDDEKVIYEAYLDYVFDWVNKNDEQKIGESPLSYEAWKAKSGELVPG